MERMIFLINNLKKERLAQGLTLDELAKMTGTTHGTISRYENGKRTPDVEFLKKLSIALNKSADYLLGLIEEEKDLK